MTRRQGSQGTSGRLRPCELMTIARAYLIRVSPCWQAAGVIDQDDPLPVSSVCSGEPQFLADAEDCRAGERCGEGASYWPG